MENISANLDKRSAAPARKVILLKKNCPSIAINASPLSFNPPFFFFRAAKETKINSSSITMNDGAIIDQSTCDGVIHIFTVEESTLPLLLINDSINIIVAIFIVIRWY